MSAIKRKLNLEMNKENFDFLSHYIYSLTGIYLPHSEKNQSLMNNRMARFYKNMTQIADCEIDDSNIVTFLQRNKNNQLVIDYLVSCITTNKTDFYREAVHFDNMLTYLKSQLNLHQNEISIWCTACSTGAEAYTIALHLKENLKPKEFDRIKILATDIDLECLNYAILGNYSSEQVSGLNNYHLKKYFSENNNYFQINNELKSKIFFSKLNLIDHEYKINKKFDVIFCRNVLIYFNNIDKSRVCSQLNHLLKNDGLFIFGLSESGPHIPNDLISIASSTYRKKA